MQVNLAVHFLPLWFLIFSLFLPRIALIVGWFDRDLVHFYLGNSLIPPILALLVPRVLILFLIYQDQGFSTWFLIHAIALLLAYGGGGHRVSTYRSRRSDRYASRYED